MFPGLVLDGICSRIAISSYVAILMAFVTFTPLALYFFRTPLALALLVVEVTLFLLPLGDKDNPWGRRFNAYAMHSYREWSNLTVIYDAGQEATFETAKTYVMGYEPHSPLPFGLPVFLGNHAPCRDPNLGDSRILATSLVNWIPGVRHLFHWLGGVPASRKSMDSLLRLKSVAVIPPGKIPQQVEICGGVAECGFMRPGKDVVFLKSRYGFVRMALRHGAPLVPMFCFGQNDAYKFLRLGPPLIPEWLFERIIRKLLFCPMLIYGQWGTPLPFRARLTLVIGKPIQTPQVAEPSHEDIQKYLTVFIQQLQDMYEKHKAAAGYLHSHLIVM